MPKHRARACRGSRHGLGYGKRKDLIFQFKPAPYAGEVQGILYPQLSLVRSMPCSDFSFGCAGLFACYLLVLFYLEISDLT
jgi:hypothetical protein